MSKQCQWCLKVYNIDMNKWEQKSAERLPWASLESCPECEEKFKKACNKEKKENELSLI